MNLLSCRIYTHPINLWCEQFVIDLCTESVRKVRPRRSKLNRLANSQNMEISSYVRVGDPGGGGGRSCDLDQAKCKSICYLEPINYNQVSVLLQWILKLRMWYTYFMRLFLQLCQVYRVCWVSMDQCYVQISTDKKKRNGTSWCNFLSSILLMSKY